MERLSSLDCVFLAAEDRERPMNIGSVALFAGAAPPLALGPHRLLEGYPVAPIAGRVRICIAIWSYVGTLAIGITGDHESVPDIGLLAAGIDRGFARLLAAARSA